MNQSRIIMSYTTAPSSEDLLVLAQETLETLPPELLSYCSDLAISVEDIADEALEVELDLEDSFELLALYRSGQEIAPGVLSKVANDDDLLILFRRPILDMWCDSGEHLPGVLREVMITEIARNFEFLEEEIDAMLREHYQGML
ncbi:MAG: metallopeptidase family protein [Rhodospirillales bacterium]|nr:metallopeptidase family protein [Rhodospirillales bacterium]